jgi:hypothetical protein
MILPMDLLRPFFGGGVTNVAAFNCSCLRSSKLTRFWISTSF